MPPLTGAFDSSAGEARTGRSTFVRWFAESEIDGLMPETAVPR